MGQMVTFWINTEVKQSPLQVWLHHFRIKHQNIHLKKVPWKLAIACRFFQDIYICYVRYSQQVNQFVYHDASEETHRLATASVGCNIPIADSEEGDGNEPQGRIHVARRCLGLPAGGREQNRRLSCWNKKYYGSHCTYNVMTPDTFLAKPQKLITSNLNVNYHLHCL